MKKLFIIFIALAGFSISSFAQDTESATATATIITPISLTKTADMSFGNIAVGTTGGTVVLTPAGARSATDGVTLPTVGPGTVTAAAFTVTGQGANTFTITLPSSNTIRIGAAGATMTVDNFSSTPSGIGTLSSGTLGITIGATLNVGASQAAGTYTSVTPFDVTVNYN